MIDNFFFTLTKHTLDSTAGILIKKFSDHQPYFLILDTALKKEQSSKFVHINIQNEAAMLKVKHYLTSCEICKKLDVSPNADTNINYNIILDEIDRAKNKFMPNKMVKLKKYKHKKSSWITKGLLKSIRYRNKLYKQLKLTNPDTFEYSVLKINLKSYNAILKRSFRIANQIYFETCFNKCQSDIKIHGKQSMKFSVKIKRKKTIQNILKKPNQL